MWISRTMALGLVVSALSMTGCKNSMKTENASLTAENQSLRDQLADRNKALDDCSTELRSRDQQLAELRRGMAPGPNARVGKSQNLSPPAAQALTTFPA